MENPAAAASAHDSTARAGRWDVLLCLLVVVLAMVASRARIEAGLIDDFAYVRTAWAFAQTGHLHYFGWSAVMLTVQTIWAAPFIKAFGATYFACRLSSQVLLLVSLALFHSMLRRCGVGRPLAAFGTCVLGLCPLTIALAATFMSDVCSLFLTLLCLECAFRIVSARNDANALAWLLFGSAVSIIGGTERQTVWLAGTVLFPCAAWLVRSRRSVVFTTIALWPVTLLAALWFTHWYAHQPFSETPQSAAGALTLDVLRRIVHNGLSATFCTCLLLLPLTGLSFVAARRIKLRTWAIVIVCSLILAAIMHRSTAHEDAGGYIPWLTGVFPSITPWRDPNPGPIFGPHGRMLLTYLQGVLMALYTYVLWTSRRQRLAPEPATTSISWKQTTILCVPFLGAYAGILILRASWSPLFDRYLLPIVAVAILFLLRYTQQHLTERVSPVAWALIAAFAWWGIAGTHDWVAVTKARMNALAALENAGIPRTQVMAAFELDAATEIDMRGSVTNVDALLFYSPPVPKESFVPGCTIYHPYTADIQGHYMLMEQRTGAEQPTAFPDVHYRAWIPPFTREIQTVACPIAVAPAPVIGKAAAAHP